jgi:acetyl-CoA carboxylase biotin carboxyl carrier protein
MTPTELPPRTAENPPSDTARTLRDEVVELARALPGDLRRLIVRSGERAIEVEWEAGACTVEAGPRPAPTATAAGPAADTEAEVPSGLHAVRAPLVGTFYAAPSPDVDPFVREGDEVAAGQPLGIVEAMKLMNPIVAEEPGTVVRILVENAASVEYDQVLMLLRPAGGPG